MTREQMLRLLDDFKSKGGVVTRHEPAEHHWSKGRWQYWFNPVVRAVHDRKVARRSAPKLGGVEDGIEN